MNIFWNIDTLYKKDKRRFNKQILELSTIWKGVYANIQSKKAGYQNHPVTKFYTDNISSLIDITKKYYFLNQGKHKSWTPIINSIGYTLYKFNLKQRFYINYKKCFVEKKAPWYIKFICRIVDIFSTPLAYDCYCYFYKWPNDIKKGGKNVRTNKNKLS